MKRNIIKALISAGAVALAVGGGVTTATAGPAAGAGASHAVMGTVHGQPAAATPRPVPAPGAIVVHDTSADHATLTADLQPDLGIPWLGTSACIDDPFIACGWVFGANLTAWIYRIAVAQGGAAAIAACHAAATSFGHPELAAACAAVVGYLITALDPQGQCLFMSWDLPPLLGYTQQSCS